jgi:hypothetical protein
MILITSNYILNHYRRSRLCRAPETHGKGFAVLFFASAHHKGRSKTIYMAIRHLLCVVYWGARLASLSCIYLGARQKKSRSRRGHRDNIVGPMTLRAPQGRRSTTKAFTAS